MDICLSNIGNDGLRLLRYLWILAPPTLVSVCHFFYHARACVDGT